MTMTKYLTIDERGETRRFVAPDIDTVRAWAGRNGFVLTSIEVVTMPGRWDKFEPLPADLDALKAEVRAMPRWSDKSIAR